VKVKLADQSYT